MKMKGQIIYALFLVILILGSCTQKANYKYTAPDDKLFANIEVSGSNFDMGYAVGSVFRNDILRMLEIRKEWFTHLKQIAHDQNNQLYNQFLEKATEAYPQYVNELKGMAEGSGIPFEDLFILNCQSELSAIAKQTEGEHDACSSIYTINEDEMIFMHNEDGHRANSEFMFVVKAFPESGINFVALSYPGLLLGNGPAMNSKGIVQAVNYISSTQAKIGIPRYFINRAILESQSLDEAVSIACNPDRAFSYHHNLMSMKDKKWLSLELTPYDSCLITPHHLYVHTNHLISDKLAASPQNDEYVSTSSMNRYLALQEEISDREDTRIDLKEGLKMLSSHRYAPFSPCRHPEGEVKGITLATAVVDLSRGKFMLFKGNPCHSVDDGAVQEFSLADLELQ